MHKLSLTAAAAFLLIAGAASAQNAAPSAAEQHDSASSAASADARGDLRPSGEVGAFTSSTRSAGYNSRTTADTEVLPSGASLTVTTVTNGPVPDTRENRARFGSPDSHGGRMTAPAGN